MIFPGLYETSKTRTGNWKCAILKFFTLVYSKIINTTLATINLIIKLKLSVVIFCKRVAL